MSLEGSLDNPKLPEKVSLAFVLGGVVWLFLGPLASGVQSNSDVRLVSDAIFLLLVGAISYYITSRISYRERRNVAEIRSVQEKYEAFIANSSEGIWRFDIKEPIPVGTPTLEMVALFFERSYVSECNLAVAKMYGCDDPSAMIGLPLTSFFDPEDPVSIEFLVSFIESGFRLCNVETHETDLKGNKVRFVNNLVADVSSGFVTHAWGMQRDITLQRESEVKIQDQLKRLAQLTQIDRSILSGSGFEHTVAETISAVKASPYVEDVRITLTTGRVVDPEQYETSGAFLAFSEWRQEAINLKGPYFVNETSRHGFDKVCSYLALPIITSDNLIGVIEIIFDSENRCEPECLTFFEMVAGQLSIAFENAVTFENLAKSTFEMQTAYDATLRGWVKALDLRDKETEGHSRRVTAMTLDLAKEMGIEGEALDHIHRGALLHDIGKIGIPDGVLLKPGPLSPDEYKLMQTHPVLAYEWLKPIDFLHSALDIPYSHHEKWDGSGYPQGLVAEDIPIAARIFAIVDVFDALTSDRPYKSAMSEEDAMSIIREQNGKHFDPEVCRAFERLMAKRRSALAA